MDFNKINTKESKNISSCTEILHKKPLQPIITENPEEAAGDYGLEVLKDSTENETVIGGKLFKGVRAEEEDFSHLLMRGVRFSNCQFWNCTFSWAEFSDVEFQSCDFSGCNFSNCDCERVIFSLCKGVGTKFASSRMSHTLFWDCNMNYSNFDQSILKSVIFRQVELNSSNLAQCKCKEVLWDNVQLVNASFFKTSLRGMDFTTSVIQGLILSDEMQELKGAVMDIYQAAEMARRLGIVIK